MCKGWFHRPNTHWPTVHLWQNETSRKDGDRPAGEDQRRERPGYLDALFLCQAKGALTHHQPMACGGTAYGSRAPSGGRLYRGCPSLPSIYQQTPTAACASDVTAPMHWGAWGPNKRHRVYTGALLATTVNACKRGLKAVCNGGILGLCYLTNRDLPNRYNVERSL